MEIFAAVFVGCLIWFIIFVLITSNLEVFSLKRKVYFLDYLGEIRLSREYVNGFAYVYPSLGTGLIALKSDGTTSSPLIKRWSYNLKDLID